jgi:hypothetical protein
MLLPPMQIASDMLFDNFLGSSQLWSGGLVAETPTAKKKKKKTSKLTPSPLSKACLPLKIKARMERKSSLRRFSVARACLHKLTSSRVIL